jgi:uncharacterized membrane protein
MPAFLVHFASLFALALWVGGGAALSFIAAPALFEHAGSRQKAGDLVGHILRRFDTVAFIAGSVALLAIGLELAGTVGAARTLTLKGALVAAMLGLALYSRFALAPQIRALREAMGNVDEVPREDPRRAAFGRLHGFSVLCLLAQILLGAFAMGLSVMTLTAKVG